MPNHFLEVSRLEQGLKTDVRRLSRKGEWTAGTTMAGVCVLAAALSLMMALTFMSMLHRVVFAPKLLWSLATFGGAATWWLVRAAKQRARHVHLGPSMGDDGFAPIPVDLARRLEGSDDAFELGIVAGMSGEIQSARMTVPLEALAPPSGSGPRYRRIEAGEKAVVRLGTETYLLERRTAEASPEWSFGKAAAGIPRRWLAVGALGCLAVAFFSSIPAGGAVTQLKPPIVSARRSSGWEAEMELRLEAQLQAPSLYECFDKLPQSCQRPGYVAVGLSLTREGEIRSHWIASSTYNETCPVTACMGDIVALWQFNSLPEPMRVVLPVQVLRTSKAFAPVKLTSTGGNLPTFVASAH